MRLQNSRNRELMVFFRRVATLVCGSLSVVLYPLSAKADSNATHQSALPPGIRWDSAQVPMRAANSEPGAVNCIPADGSIVSTELNILDWDDIREASTYEVYFGTNASPGQRELLGADSISQWPLPWALEPNTTYYWRIVAKNRYGGTTGSVWRFTTMAIPPPSAPSSPLPADGQPFVSLSLVALDWADSKGAGSYSLYFGTTPKFGKDHLKGNFSDSKWPLDCELAPATKYYWQVVAKNAGGSTTGAVWRFGTASVHLPEAPTAPVPADGQASVSLSLVALDWADVKGAGSYSLYFGTTPKLGKDHRKGSFNDSKWLLDCELSPATKYYWQVVAKNVCGSTTGAVWRFTTQGAAQPPGF